MESAEIVRRVGGLAHDLDVTYATKSGTSIKVTGGTGLQLRLAVAPGALVADIREVERVCRMRNPHESFAFIDYIQPIASTAKKAELDARFDGLLGTSDGGGRVVPVVPVPALDDLSAAHSFTLQIGTGTPPPREQLELRYFLQRTLPMRAGTRMAALRRGYVRMNADGDGTEVLARIRADRWLEARTWPTPTGAGSSYMDGNWYEIGDQYVQASRHEIARLFPCQPSLDLPPWFLASGRDEGNYNAHVPCVRNGYVCLDKNKRVRNPLGLLPQQRGDLRPARPGQRAHPRQARQGIRTAQPPVLPGARLRADPPVRTARGTRAVRHRGQAAGQGEDPGPLTSGPRRSCSPSSWRTARNSPPTPCTRSHRSRWRTSPGSSAPTTSRSR